MDYKNGRLTIAAFLIIIINTIEAPNYIKYFLLGVGLISLLLGVRGYYRDWSTNRQLSNQINSQRNIK